MDLFRWLKNSGWKDWPPPPQVPEGPPGPVVRRRYRFSGVVQGVGFRYEAKFVASGLELAGWVRNEADGSVTVEIEGGADRVGAFLLAMEAVPRFDITDVREEELPPSGTGKGFHVLY